MRSLGVSLLCLSAACTLPAAPVPRPKEWRFAPGLDRPIDPDRNCTFTFGQGALTIGLPGKDHDIAPARKRVNAPRVLRPADGDFRLEVRVTGDFRLSEAPATAGVETGAAGGLVIMADGERGLCLAFELGVTRDRQGRARRHVHLRNSVTDKFNHRIGQDEQGEGWAYPAGASTAYLKFELRHTELRDGTPGCRLMCYDSPDGKKWQKWDNLQYATYTGVPKKPRVGVFASSTATTPCKFTFDQFKLTPIPPERPSHEKK